jgi:hypothetical protein
MTTLGRRGTKDSSTSQYATDAEFTRADKRVRKHTIGELIGARLRRSYRNRLLAAKPAPLHEKATAQRASYELSSRHRNHSGVGLFRNLSALGPRRVFTQGSAHTAARRSAVQSIPLQVHQEALCVRPGDHHLIIIKVS